MQSVETKGTLIVFTRWPEPGRTKVRLASCLGAAGAANLHRALVEHTLLPVRATVDLLGLGLEIHHTGSVAAMRNWLGADLVYRSQIAGDLGARMSAALSQATGPVVLIGTDCPALTWEILTAAFGVLRNRDVVLGPATDGGYSLVGWRRPRLEIFRDIPWGSAQVHLRTKDRLLAAGVTWAEVATLSDIDRPEDLALVPQHLLPSTTTEDT